MGVRRNVRLVVSVLTFRGRKKFNFVYLTLYTCRWGLIRFKKVLVGVYVTWKLILDSGESPSCSHHQVRRWFMLMKHRAQCVVPKSKPQSLSIALWRHSAAAGKIIGNFLRSIQYKAMRTLLPAKNILLVCHWRRHMAYRFNLRAVNDKMSLREES